MGTSLLALAKSIYYSSYVTHRLTFQILPRIFFSCGGVAGNVIVKKTHKNVWAFKWCRV